MENPVVTLKQASKSFVDGKDTHSVLDSVDFTLATGASVALTGASGSGKSTLLNLIAGFEPLSGGELWLDGDNTSVWKDHNGAASAIKNWALSSSSSTC